MTAPDAATKAQIEAIAPDRSTWLSANAGSGKTRVLTTRVALLLLAGTNPQNILCLTYTKAAAAEMQNRLFRRLGSWAMTADDALTQALRDMGVTEPLGAERLRRARTLFAAAIETPGGLRIQTIHSFCGALLRRFPLEAGVTPLFRELDERGARDMYTDVLRGMAAGAAQPALRRMASLVSDPDLTALARDVAGKRANYATARTEAAIRAAYRLPPEAQTDAIRAELLSEAHADLSRRLIQALSSSGDRDADHAANLGLIDFTRRSDADLDALFRALLFAGGNTPFGPKISGSWRVMNSALRRARPDLAAEADAWMKRAAVLRPVVHAERAVERTLALEQFARAFLADYAAAKRAGGWLDFDDLIERATALLSDPAVADWVLYRLDGGIDNILVDEAQDTSPAQWQVIRLLAQNFGLDPDDRRNRTVFVVGDPKQSIYSFQGADPAAFDEMRAHFSERLAALNQSLHDRALHHSFRSSPAILNVVDNVIGRLDGGGFSDAGHIAHKSGMPGRVDVWPVLYSAEKRDDPPWFDPVDLRAPDDDRVVLAGVIADQIRAMLGSQIPDGDGGFRPIREGDFLILVQRRSDLFHEIIRACKDRGLEVAGADRLKLSGELAVKDLRAVLAFCALPQDDLSLAEALRSPLFGLTEQDLFTLAWNRGGATLWQRLRASADTYPEPAAMLRDLMGQADFLSPYDLLERVLTRWAGRKRLLARLGPEADDGIDALLALARDYEATGPASLTGFLAWLDADRTEVKRQAESAGDRIRVMTTHGAKGLESPIVILPETQELRGDNRVAPLIASDGTAVWPSPAGEQTQLGDAAEQMAATGREQERLRLLYVAMTRAEKWLIVCGAGRDATASQSWHARIAAAVGRTDCSPIQIPGVGEGMRHQHGDWPHGPAQPGDDRDDAPALPQWAREPAPPPPSRLTVINPSRLAAGLSGASAGTDANPFAAQRGTAIHLLLESLPDLPASEREGTGRAILATQCRSLPEDQHASALDEALAVLADPALAHVFAGTSLAEIGLSAPAGDDERIAGVIDRLIVTGDTVTIVDFKSHSRPPDRPEDTPVEILLQMAAYRRAVEQIFPDRAIDMQILWTAGPHLMGLPHDIVMGARPPKTIS